MATKLIVQNTPVTVIIDKGKDYICLTDMAGAKTDGIRAADIIKNWLRNRYTIEFLGTWEMIHNPDFKVVEFDHFRMHAGLPNFVLSATEWIERRDKGTGTCPIPIVMEYQVTHFRFLDTIRDFPTPPAEYVRNVQPAGHLPTGAGTEDRRGHQPSGRHTLRRQIHLQLCRALEQLKNQ